MVQKLFNYPGDFDLPFTHWREVRWCDYGAEQ
jgi:hypothetical protein